MVNKTEKSVEFSLRTIKMCRFEIKCLLHKHVEGTSRVCGRSLTLASRCFLFVFTRSLCSNVTSSREYFTHTMTTSPSGKETCKTYQNINTITRDLGFLCEGPPYAVAFCAKQWTMGISCNLHSYGKGFRNSQR